ncbi:PVC-type heme-binding CxxCH protein [Schlesneria sp. T3-172]|uniref:PVC-type heme-binding CxxCH protein n=1 Tax=Schlesneria sphaerica TaxID=3373610 RepID=UPI0037CA5D8E
MQCAPKWFVRCLLTAGMTLLAGFNPLCGEESDFSGELPSIPGKSPDESLKAIRLKGGFHAELVAAEPLIRSPMGMTFDEYGRAFVVELPEYNQYASPAPHGKGSIRRLVDTDGDGRFDQATVYVDDLDYPTAVACWNGGILVGVAPDILFCKDTDGDGIADIQQRLFTGFGQDKAGEGMFNSFQWRFDNRFHIPTGLDGGEIVAVADPSQADQKIDKPINVRGQHLLLEPRQMTLTATSGGGQHGMSLDRWQLRGFVCGNSEPVHMIMYDGRYLSRNPYLQAPAAAINIAPEGKFTKLMRISPVEPWRILRTRLRSQGAIPGSDEGGSASGFFTGATGITSYQGDAWPNEFLDNVFVGEVANNLVYRARLEPAGVGLTAHRADAEAEFLASSDNWFRPVQFANAPDGTLYVIDMYRQLIEGAAFLAPQILKHMDTSAGANQGRIYRIAPDGFQPKPVARLGDLPTVELVKLLEHTNGWHRLTASRLIYERQDSAAIAPLNAMAKSSSSPLARIMALYSLQGLSALEPSLVISELRSDDPRARQHALRLAESFVDRPDVAEAVVAVAQDNELSVRYQAAFTLGAFPAQAATTALSQLALKDGADAWMQLAILSSVGDRRGEFFTQLLKNPQTRQEPQIRKLLVILAEQMGAANSKTELTQFLKELNSLSESPADHSLAVELVRNVVNKHSSLGELLDGTAGGKVHSILATMADEAEATAQNESQATDARVNAIRTLGVMPFDRVQATLANLITPREPQPIQAAALETLSRYDSDNVAAMMIDVWKSQTPPLRATSVETLFSRPQWIGQFLDAVSDNRIATAELDPARIALLKKHQDAKIRERAEKLFAGATIDRRADVVAAYQSSLEKAGDVERGRALFRKTCAACHKLEGVGESIGADLNAIKDRGMAAVMLNILDPNREVKPQFFTYVVALESGRTVTGMIAAETANSLTLRKSDNTTETILRVDIEEIVSTGLSFMPEGLEKQLDVAAMADLLAYLNASK